jgi:hypothetical protein
MSQRRRIAWALGLWLCAGLGERAALAESPQTTPLTVAEASAEGAGARVAHLVALTEGFYQAAAARAADCGALTDALEAYLNNNATAWVEVVSALTADVEAARLSKDALAATLRDILDGSVRIKPGREAIYACVRAREPQGRKRPLSKLMQRVFDLHEPLLRAVMGPLEKDER